MALPVSLEQVADELEILIEGATVYVHRKTGEILGVMADDFTSPEEWGEEMGADEEMLAKLREIPDSDDWVALPDQYAIHEWQIMEDFARTVQRESLREELLGAIHRRGAFRQFKDAVQRHGLQDDWFQYKRNALIEIARAALEEAGIPCR